MGNNKSCTVYTTVHNETVQSKLCLTWKTMKTIFRHRLTSHSLCACSKTQTAWSTGWRNADLSAPSSETHTHPHTQHTASKKAICCYLNTTLRAKCSLITFNLFCLSLTKNIIILIIIPIHSTQTTLFASSATCNHLFYGTTCT